MNLSLTKALSLLGLLLVLVFVPACGGGGGNTSSLNQETVTPVNFDLDAGDTKAIAVLLWTRGCIIPFRAASDPANLDPVIFDACVEAIKNIGELDGINSFDAGDFLRRLKLRIDTEIASGVDPAFWNAILDAWLVATQSIPNFNADTSS